MPSERQKHAGWLYLPTDETTPLIDVCLKIPNTVEDRAAFRGTVYELAKHWNWAADDPTGYEPRFQHALYWRELLEKYLNIGCCDMLRANPDNPCELQTSCDGGETWTTLIDMSECVKTAVSPLLDAQSQKLIDDLLDAFDGTAASVTEHLTYDGGPDDSARDAALCSALELYIEMLCNVAVSNIQKNLDVLDSLRNIVNEIIDTTAVFVFTVFPPAAIGLLIANVIIDIGLTYWELAQEVVFNDLNARRQLQCCMYNALAGNTITLTGFQGSLDACGFTFGTPAAQLAGALSPLLAAVKAFLAFIQIEDQLFPLAKAGWLDNYCPDCAPGCPEVIVPMEPGGDYTIEQGSKDRRLAPLPRFTIQEP